MAVCHGSTQPGQCSFQWEQAFWRCCEDTCLINIMQVGEEHTMLTFMGTGCISKTFRRLVSNSAIMSESILSHRGLSGLLHQDGESSFVPIQDMSTSETLCSTYLILYSCCFPLRHINSPRRSSSNIAQAQGKAFTGHTGKCYLALEGAPHGQTVDNTA